MNFWAFWGRGVNFGVNFFENLQKCVNFWATRHSERNEVKRRIHELKAILRLWIFRYAQNDKMVANSVNFNANSAQNSQKFSPKNAHCALWIASTATQSRNDEFLREFKGSK